MDNAPHYMLVSTDDRDYLARAIEAMPESHERTRLLDRFRNETGDSYAC